MCPTITLITSTQNISSDKSDEDFYDNFEASILLDKSDDFDKKYEKDEANILSDELNEDAK